MVQKVNNMFKILQETISDQERLYLPHLSVCSLVAGTFVEYITTLS